MFRRRRDRSLKDAVEKAADPELRQLRETLALLQERVAELELDLFDARATISQFETNWEHRIGPLEQQKKDLEEQLERARRAAERRAQWGERADSDRIPDVVAQFERAWTPRSEPAAAPPPPAPAREPDIQALKKLYRSLAKRFHPDLTTDLAEKSWREKRMAEVNIAYSQKDLAALQALSDAPERPAPEISTPTFPQDEKAPLRREIHRLETLIRGLERQLDELLRSESLKLQLEASIAARSGRDLLGEIAREFRAQISELQARLADFNAG